MRRLLLALLCLLIIGLEFADGRVYALQAQWEPAKMVVPPLLFLAYMVGVAVFDKERDI